MPLVLSAAMIAACAGCSNTSVKPQTFNASIGDRSIPIEVSGPLAQENAQVAMRFLKAFANSDANELKEAVTTDFVWFLHDGNGDFRGRTVSGVDGIIQVKKERSNDWSNVTYSDVHFYVVGNRIVQTYRVTGNSRQFGPFDANGVDLYLVRDGRIAIKDSYWKQ